MSKKEINLLIGLLGIIIAFCSYQFVFLKVMSEADELEKENNTLKTEIARLQSLEQNRDTYIADTEKMETEIKELIGEFPSNLLPEDDMKLAYGLDNNNPSQYLLINTLTFSDPAVIYTTNQNATEQTSSNGVVSTATVYPTYYLYQTQVNLGVDCAYDGLKNAIRGIYNANGRKAIENVSVAYDETTGRLNGSVLMDSYYVVGQDKAYAQPNLTPVRQGTDNIFKTVQMQDTENEEVDDNVQ